jgi:hypothetical protein
MLLVMEAHLSSVGFVMPTGGREFDLDRHE